MEVLDDRVVPAGRRHRLPAASLEQLPVGRWVTVGPYTPAEWAARGENGAGSGAYLRLNRTAYLVAVEHGDTAGWRLEDVAARTGHGLLATGTAPTLDDAREDAVATVRARYPALATTPPELTAPAPAGTAGGWEPIPGEGRSAAEQRRLDDRITVYVIPGPGGRWMPAVDDRHHGTLNRLPLVRGIEEARTAAELAGHRAARIAAVADPAHLDTTVAAFADGGDYTRRELAELVGHRLEPADRDRIDTAPPAQLAEVLGAAGLSPAAIVAVLHAEHVDPETMTPLLPTIGVPMPDAIRVLHDRWDVPRVDAAAGLGATAAEMRDAGCTPTEIMAARPRDILRNLPADAHLWELAAGTMATAGHPPHVIAAHLVAHTPDLDTFATGLTAGIDQPATGLAAAARSGATGDQLAAASEAYGLDRPQTAAVLVDAGTPTPAVLDALDARCDHDTDRSTDLARQAGVPGDDIDRWLHPTNVPAVPSLGAAIDRGDAAALLAVLPPPDPGRSLDRGAGLGGMHPTEPTPLEPSPT